MSDIASVRNAVVADEMDCLRDRGHLRAIGIIGQHVGRSDHTGRDQGIALDHLRQIDDGDLLRVA